MVWGVYTTGDAPRGRPWFLSAAGIASRDRCGQPRWFATRAAAFRAWLADAGLHDEFDYAGDESDTVDRAASNGALVARGIRSDGTLYCVRLSYRLGAAK